jgi:hypothetical protein
MSEQQTEKEILDLIELVDKNKDANGKPLFRGRDIFGGSFGSAIFIIGALFFLVIFFSLLYDFGKISLVDSMVLDFTFIAVLLTFLSTIIQFGESSMLEVRFKKALGLRPSFTENQKLILKALIKIRSKHEKFALKDVYGNNKEMFTKEKLIEKLYD